MELYERNKIYIAESDQKKLKDHKIFPGDAALELSVKQFPDYYFITIEDNIR